MTRIDRFLIALFSCQFDVCGIYFRSAISPSFFIFIILTLLSACVNFLYIATYVVKLMYIDQYSYIYSYIGPSNIFVPLANNQTLKPFFVLILRKNWLHIVRHTIVVRLG